MDSEGNNASASTVPSPILKQEKKRKPTKKQTFKLCFNIPLEIGRSNLSIYKTSGFKPFVTSKFYEINPFDSKPDDTQIIYKKLEKINTEGPREKYENPIIESHKYGWYQCKLVEDKTKIKYAKQTSDMVKFRILAIAEDQRISNQPAIRAVAHKN